MKKAFKKTIPIAFSILVALLGIFLYFWKQIPTQRINFLILGIAGENHQGKDLTDTIIFSSFNPETGKVLLLSIPRDLWVPKWQAKLNSIYHYKGLEEMKKTTGEILGQEINYGVLVDFEIFKKLIDNLGGITVEVERNFDDYKYPIAGKENDLCAGDPEYKCRYEHLHFESGKQSMDGETALKFVRSRNAEGEEGTDFARALRQQKVILGIKDKILSPKFLLSPGKLLQLFKLFTLNIQTDIPKEKYLSLLKMAIKINTKEIKTTVLNNDYLITPKNTKEKYGNQWVLIPKAGNWEEIQKYIKKLLTSN